MPNNILLFNILDNSIDPEKYKKLIINIALILSTISILFSIIAILVVKLFPQDQDGSYEELNISIEENTMPKTFVCIRKNSIESSNKEKCKIIDSKNSVIAPNNKKDNSSEDVQTQKEIENGKNFKNDQTDVKLNDVKTNSPKIIKVTIN
ncbi:conserved Plasmodium protein, unknown function [Plasmodium berghei]|uniref:Uncharacterized protein n=2 Tax=Plasmodium berghei TaxID=5821 RepID=A0A509AP00_PLABA|nr:conserved Plasmodium protein, unknown function [Plasmodium berghei ANKA]CXI97652.1 conserved Plasmodium protein, unknown function [Plasmodium berghei]SCL97570.1 conserved Plasmodium protein, unknown function [Plasmodium berghei]SCM16636.1 conserved Plasmodium protein, unknown function [Plasmodium berghei]SCM18433.1 conserved Plasmodium protein, unknown function [Plasmodium berghei]SCN27864.1 conserved Plasmodium protein, unknown function [Plasmodium berghei]|eukprot:XP_034423518.1 conserved Plasmodium protein, unknown function [Plasmodium berghei ANKA]